MQLQFVAQKLGYFPVWNEWYGIETIQNGFNFLIQCIYRGCRQKKYYFWHSESSNMRHFWCFSKHCTWIEVSLLCRVANHFSCSLLKSTLLQPRWQPLLTNGFENHDLKSAGLLRLPAFYCCPLWSFRKIRGLNCGLKMSEMFSAWKGMLGVNWNHDGARDTDTPCSCSTHKNASKRLSIILS